MRQRSLLAAVLLIGCVASSFASRLPHVDEILAGGSVFGQHDAGTNNFQKLIEWMDNSRNSNTEEDERVYVQIGFMVPTDKQEDFVRSWREHAKSTMDEEGTEIYDLKKSHQDNIIYFAYGEWSSMEEFKEHAKADHTKKFYDFLDDTDVLWRMFPLHNKGDNQEREDSLRTGGGGEGEEEKAHVLVRYFVPPAHTDDFEDAWTQAAEETWKEEKNHIYALRKTVTANHEYWVYGTWESFDDYMEHFHSSHIRKLRDFNNKRKIVWFAIPLKKMGEQPEF